MVCMVCVWVIWNGWAAFFMWLTSWSVISNQKTMYDFYNLYAEGRWWLSGAYTTPGTHVFSFPFAYPPSSLPVFGFFAQFPFGVAAQLWTAMGLTVFLVALFSVAITFKPERKYLFISITALLFFTSYPLRVELQLGQINLFLASLTILSLTAQRSNHGRVSALLLALGTLLKGPPVLFLLYFVLFRRDLAYLAHFLESTVAILGISLFVVPVQLYWVWFANIFPNLFVGAGMPVNESITGALSMSGLAYLTPAVFMLGLCILAAFAYHTYPRQLSKTGGSPVQSSMAGDAMFLLNSLVLLLIGTRSWPQDYVWVILPTALFLSALLVGNVKASYFMVVCLAAFLFNFDSYPLFMYYLSQYTPHASLVPYVQMIGTSMVGGLLMIPCLILLFLRPQAILQRHR